MIEKTRLDMIGLKYMAIAYIVSLCSGTVAGFLGSINGMLNSSALRYPSSEMAGMAGAGSVGSALINGISMVAGIAVLVLLILGLSKLGKYSVYFKKAMTFYIANLITAIVFVIVMVFAMVMVLIGQLEVIRAGDISAAKSFLVVMILLIVVYIALQAWLGIMYVRNLCLGCREVSVAVGDDMSDASFKGLEKLYRICMIIYAVGVSLCLIGVMFTTLRFVSRAETMRSSIDSGSIFGLVGSIIVFVLVLLLFVLMMFVVEIVLTVRLWKGWKALDGKEVTVQRSGDVFKLLAPQAAEAAPVQPTAAPEAPTPRGSVTFVKENPSSVAEPEAPRWTAPGEAPEKKDGDE